jgi:hypothetical protein
LKARKHAVSNWYQPYAPVLHIDMHVEAGEQGALTTENFIFALTAFQATNVQAKFKSILGD